MAENSENKESKYVLDSNEINTVVNSVREFLESRSELTDSNSSNCYYLK